MPENYIDPMDILSSNLIHYRTLFIGSTIYEKTKALLSKTIAFPNPAMQLPIVCSYLWSNPKFSQCIPILFCYGQPGSAKSNLGRIAGKLRNAEPINLDNCTPASLRNACNHAKFLDEDQEYEADGALLIADNAQINTFQRLPNLYSLFLSGYKRGTDKMTIASRDGGNIEFWTFSGRIISSVEAIHLEYDFRELGSRCLILPHLSFDKITQEALDIQGFDPEQSIKPEDIDWRGFGLEYLKVWGDKTFCYSYAAHRQSLRVSKKITPRQWEMSRDLLATGMSIGIWETPKEAKDFIVEYYEFIENAQTKDTTPLEEILKDEFIEGLISDRDEFANRLLVNFVNMKTSANAFLEKPKPKQIEDAMKRLGWRKTKEKWVRAEA